MAMYLPLIIGIITFILLSDIWFYRKMKKRGFYLWFRILSLLPALFFICTMFYIRYEMRDSADYQIAANIQWVIFTLVTIYFPKYIYILFYHINKAYNYVRKKQVRTFRQIGFATAIFMIAFLVYGAVVTTNDFYVKEQVISVEDLPDGFEDYKIVLLADFHLGNWNNRYKIMQPIIRLVNQQKADIIIFAGDLINNYADETYGWEQHFKQLHAQQGMYAVLGNHDYGDYTNWDSKEEKMVNLETTKNNIRSLGFNLLLNEHTEIIKDGDTLTLVGVENYGSVHFARYSDLKKALKGTDKHRKKILITHDPTHWQEEVIDKHPNIFLTLSGHTHAAQLGIMIGKFKFSPASLIYPQWDGLYRHNQQYIYVNRGMGFVGVPLRIGVPPEITILRLKKKRTN